MYRKYNSIRKKANKKSLSYVVRHFSLGKPYENNEAAAVRETLERTLHKRALWHLCKPSLDQDTINWNGSSDFITCFLCARSCCINWVASTTSCLKEETLGYQVIQLDRDRDEDEDERSFDLGGVSHCSSALPWQPYETYLNGCLCCSRLSFVFFFARAVLGTIGLVPEREQYLAAARQKLLNFLPSFRSYFTQFTIWTRRLGDIWAL